ncbi:hypothetical protein LTR36_006820 [Oleoguttula mirabilis]|uniref:HAUS augmin-like complex subunit 1 n=1 Tax=Oleoguttula mirabilis TaxID=1507867 RepID=A0AAV9JB38_9PEZI|nr:hypothetical protein LTR36_006820 [Oleoguttula mirabilis]
MDSPAEWTASALFSPSKARVQQAQAKDWAYVEGWLAKKYGKRIPTFERNEETLQALLTLATFNETADEQQALVEKVEKAVLQASVKRVPGEDELYSNVRDGLGGGGEGALNALAESAVLLGTNAIAQAAEWLCSLTAERFELNGLVRRVDVQRASLKREQARLTALLQDVKQSTFCAPGDISEQTVEWTRSAKHLKAKVTEYDERLGALRSASSPSPSIEDIIHQLQVLDSHRMRLDKISGEVSAFDSLPSDVKAARSKIENARAQLRTLTTERDVLFEGLADTR